jgi:hypothetical protein
LSGGDDGGHRRGDGISGRFSAMQHVFMGKFQSSVAAARGSGIALNSPIFFKIAQKTSDY